MSAQASSRPGGRTARVRAAVLDAADALVAGGREPVSVKDLSEAAGVSEPTIYRRWRTAENVLLDAAVRHLAQQSPPPATGDLRADLLVWAAELERGIATPAGLRFLSMVIGARTAAPESGGAVASFTEERVEQLRAVLATDGAPAWLTAEQLLDHVLAPLYVRQLLGYTAQSGAAELVDRLLT